MKGRFHDVVIAGAGPAGLHAARCCEKAGLDTVVIEEHKDIGRPCHCSGLISANLRNIVPLKRAFVEHKVRGAVMHSPGGKELKLEKKGTAAYVIDRTAFDSYLADRTGAEILTGNRVSGFRQRDDRIEVSAGREYGCSLLMGCDGSGSLIREKLGLKPKEMLFGIIAIAKGSKDDRSSEFVDMWFDKRWTDGFMWKIPRGDSVEYGMLGSNAKFSRLEGFFGLDRYEKAGGTVPLGPVKSYHERVLLVGDAAAQVKPWSGGGVIYSLTAAGIAAEAAAEAKKSMDFSERALRGYEMGWKARFGKQITAGMAGRSVFKRMSNSQLDLAFSGMARVRKLMNKLDMDFLTGKGTEITRNRPAQT
ncbi:MAG: hypothetical protein DRO99_01795 [Candidatus Aenigmatarchaeota archaeon]|mgnify:CR=1 FL=1|nr:MAG: hypothetical protein DRO99_01795 [Candidatus Aenigmarchaeota archaeon]